MKKSEVIFTKEISIYWGDYSQIEAELELFETAQKHGEYSMYHLLSGVDLPLDTAENIYNFFDKNKYNSFVNISPKEIYMKAKAQNRIKYWWFNTKKINKRNTNSRFIKLFYRFYRKLEIETQRAFKSE